MILTLLSHIYKNFSRSSSFRKDVSVQVAVIFIALAFAGYSLALGFALEGIIGNTLRQDNAIVFLNGVLVYYFIGEFITRYFMQSLPSLEVQPYLHLPVSRAAIVNFLLTKSVFHILNVFVFLLFAPFAFSAVARTFGMEDAWVWLLSLWLVSMIIHFLVMLLKRTLQQSIWGMAIFCTVSALFACADYFGWLKLSEISESFFGSALQNYTVIFALSITNALLYYVIYAIFKKRLYSDELSTTENIRILSGQWSFLQKLGTVGSWIRIEVKLIFRNKRSRELFLLHCVFIILAFAMYTRVKTSGNYGVALFFGTICSGFFMMNYGQYLFSWQASHFDFTLTQPTSIRLFVESKFWLLTATTVLWLLFSVPMVYLGWQFMLVNFATSVFNIGVNTFIVMNISMWGAKRIDLKHSGSLNYEGMGAAQWILGIPLFVSPYIFYLPFWLAGYPQLGLLSVSIAGVIGIMFHKKLIDFTARRLLNMRYVRAADFRKE